MALAAFPASAILPPFPKDLHAAYLPSSFSAITKIIPRPQNKKDNRVKSTKLKWSMPTRLTIINGAVASDGGSIDLEAIDEQGKAISLFLDWSIAAQQNGTTHIRIAENRIEKGTEEECLWLTLLQEASIHGENDPQEHNRVQTTVSGIILPPDIRNHFEALRIDDAYELRFLVIRFVMLALSERFVDPQGAEAIRDKVRSLLAAGDRIGAMKLLRDSDPTMTLKTAQQTIESISSEN